MDSDMRAEVTALAINVTIPEALRWTDTRRGVTFTLTTLNVRLLGAEHQQCNGTSAVITFKTALGGPEQWPICSRDAAIASSFAAEKSPSNPTQSATAAAWRRFRLDEALRSFRRLWNPGRVAQVSQPGPVSVSAVPAAMAIAGITAVTVGRVDLLAAELIMELAL